MKWVLRRSLPGRERGGVWWVALSDQTPEQLERAFREERAAGLLYRCVGEIRKSKSTVRDNPFDKRLILLQLRVPAVRIEQEYLKECLGELGVELLNRKDNHEAAYQRTA